MFSEARYDEMQELARGREFKMGYTCMTFVLVGYIFYDYIAPRSAISIIDGVLVFKEIYAQFSLGIAFGLTGIMLLIRLLMNKREQED